jgi:hypothetical protein
MYEPQELLWRGPFPCHDYIFWQGNGKFLVPGDKKIERSPGRYQELDLFIKVLRLLCPNLTDVSRGWILTLETRLGHRPFPSIFPESYHLVTNWLWKEGNGQEPVNFVKDEEVPSLRRVKIGTSSSPSGEILFKVNKTEALGYKILL